MAFKFIVSLLDARFTYDSLNNLAQLETIDFKVKRDNIRLFDLLSTIHTFLSSYKYIGIFLPTNYDRISIFRIIEIDLRRYVMRYREEYIFRAFFFCSDHCRHKFKEVLIPVRADTAPRALSHRIPVQPSIT